jgi:hypothetical protein
MGFVFFVFSSLGFVLWWVFFRVFVKFRKFFITKNLVIIYKLNTINIFLLQREALPSSWFF